MATAFAIVSRTGTSVFTECLMTVETGLMVEPELQAGENVTKAVMINKLIYCEIICKKFFIKWSITGMFNKRAGWSFILTKCKEGNFLLINRE